MDIKQSKLQTAETIKCQREWLKTSKQTEHEQNTTYQKQMNQIKVDNCRKVKFLINE